MAYNNVFASRTPPAHILIRDYARGIIERAIHLGCDLELDEQFIRPPYRSTWPSIPYGLELFWVVLGEKQIVGGGDRMKFHGRLKMSGGYGYTGNRPLGSVNFNADIPEDCANSSREVQDDAVSDGRTREV